MGVGWGRGRGEDRGRGGHEWGDRPSARNFGFSRGFPYASRLTMLCSRQAGVRWRIFNFDVAGTILKVGPFRPRGRDALVYANFLRRGNASEDGSAQATGPRHVGVCPIFALLERSLKPFIEKRIGTPIKF